MNIIELTTEINRDSFVKKLPNEDRDLGRNDASQKIFIPS